MISDTDLDKLSTLIKKGVANALKEVHTSMPGIIESFDSTTQTASVQPAIRRILRTDEGGVEVLTPSDIPLLINVPVQFPRGGGYSFTLPVKKGDECLLVFCERVIDNWHNRGGVQNPAGKRFHSFSDATAFVGISSLPNVVPDYDPNQAQLKKDDGSASVTVGDGVVVLKADTKITIDTPETDVTGNLNVSGETHLGVVVTSDGTNISGTHYHPQGADSDGDTQQNTGTPI